MNNSLNNQFSSFLAAKDFDAAANVIKQARSLNYPIALIGSWENCLAMLNPGYIHPLDIVEAPNKEVHNNSQNLDPNLRSIFKDRISQYCAKNKLDSSLPEKIVELTFDNFDFTTGQLIIPDLTSSEPISNLFHYSVYEYCIDNPDIPEAAKRGVCPSEADHFFRCGFIEILEGIRYSSLSFSHSRKNFQGMLLYIVDDYYDLNDDCKSVSKSIQLSRFLPDIFSIKHGRVFTYDGLSMDIEEYLFYNTSENHNLCILLEGRSLTELASKWLLDIKLEDRTAIFGYSSQNGRFCALTEYSNENALVSDITNGCIIVNAIEALTVVGNINKNYKTAYGYFHALVLELRNLGVEFCLKREILSEYFIQPTSKKDVGSHGYWSPFFWPDSDNIDKELGLSLIRRDLIQTWRNQLNISSREKDCPNSNISLSIDPNDLIVKLNSSLVSVVGVVIPFKDKIHLLENCVESLMLNKEEFLIKIYAINNDSIEPSTFEGLNRLHKKYPNEFVCIDSPGEFNYAKINNHAVSLVEEEYLLFLNNDILIDSSFAITTLLKAHCFHNAIITGSKLLYPSGKIQHNGLSSTQEKHIAINSPFCGHYANLNHELLVDQYLHPWARTHECSAVTAACMLMKKDDFLSIDGFDEDFKVAYNDVDLCFRAKAKFIDRPIICSTESKIYHLESESRGSDKDDKSKTRLYHERVNLVSRHEAIFSAPDKFTGLSTPFNDIQRIVKTNFDRRFTQNTSTTNAEDINLEALYLEKIHHNNLKKYACIFVHYDKDSLISHDCVYHLRKLAEYCDIYFVSSSELLTAKLEEIQKIMSLCKQILIRKNSGYDFGCWSHVIRSNYDELCDYEGVLLVNDSNWGPMNDFSDTFKKIRDYSSDFDFMGLTSSLTPSWHLQSFFVFYSAKVFKSAFFKMHWFNIKSLASKYHIIMNYEVGWATRLSRLGFKGIALYGTPDATNPTHVNWESLLSNNYPYLKKELLRDNPLRINLLNLPKILLAYREDWRASLLDYLMRHGNNTNDTVKLLQDPP